MNIVKRLMSKKKSDDADDRKLRELEQRQLENRRRLQVIEAQSGVLRRQSK